MPKKYVRYIGKDGLPRIRIPRGATKSNRHPLLRNRVKGVWYPDLVHKVPGYPTTQEAFDHLRAVARERTRKLNEEGRFSTQAKGIPKGWAGRREELKTIHKKAEEEAKTIIENMLASGILTDDGAMANASLQAALEIVTARDDAGKYVYAPRERIQSLKTVLEFTKTKPVAKSEVSLNAAEAWLASLAQKPE